MAHLANPPGFGSNRWGEINWAKHNRTVGMPFAVAGPSDWVPTVNIGATRTIDISAGSASACGVYDETSGAETISFAANTGSSDRHDYFVASWNWITRQVTFKVIQGGSLLPGINATNVVNETQVNRIPGVRYDALLGYVRVRPGVTTFSLDDLRADLRVWGGVSGPAVTRTSIVGLLDLGPAGQVQVLPGSSTPNRDIARVENVIAIPQMSDRPTGSNRWTGQRIAALNRPTAVYVWNGTHWLQEGITQTSWGVDVPSGSYVTRQEGTSVITTTTAAGQFTVPLPMAYSSAPLWASMAVGDIASGLSAVRIYPSGHTSSSIYGQAFGDGFQPMGNGALIRVNWEAVGWNA